MVWSFPFSGSPSTAGHVVLPRRPVARARGGGHTLTGGRVSQPHQHHAPPARLLKPGYQLRVTKLTALQSAINTSAERCGRQLFTLLKKPSSSVVVHYWRKHLLVPLSAFFSLYCEEHKTSTTQHRTRTLPHVELTNIIHYFKNTLPSCYFASLNKKSPVR